MNYEDTLLLFGRSPYINEVRDKVPELCKRWHSMGCNYFVDSFPCVEMVVFYDDIMPDFKPEHLVVTNLLHQTSFAKRCNRIVRNHEKKDLYIIERTEQGFAPAGSGVLHFDYHTPTMAMNWAWQKGFKNVVLIGIDLVVGSRHFDADTTSDDPVPTWKQSGVIKAREKLRTINEQYLHLWQANPASDLDIPKVDIKELLNANA